jgi:hypothetical protein
MGSRKKIEKGDRGEVQKVRGKKRNDEVDGGKWSRIGKRVQDEHNWRDANKENRRKEHRTGSFFTGFLI